MLNVRQATLDDLQTILDFIAEASDWLKLKGTDQWAEPWPTLKKRDKRVRNGLKDGRTWMVEDDSGVPIASVTYRPQANPALWTIREQAQPAAYVSRLIVRRNYAGQAIGSELLDWVGMRAAGQYRAQWVRIDVWTTNESLHEYYQKRGFQFVRHASSRYPSAALLQRPTAGIKAAAITRLREVRGLPGSGRRAARADRHAAHPSLAWRLTFRAASLLVLYCTTFTLPIPRQQR